jgi:hypothetical protein
LGRRIAGDGLKDGFVDRNIRASMSGFGIWAVVFATLLGPVLAVQAQKWLETLRDAKARKRALFKTLMAHRSVMVSPMFVEALNQIDLEFHRDRKVIEAWRSLLDHLTTPGEGKQSGWEDDRDKYLTDLLYELSISLGYKFDRVQIRKGFYHPIAHNKLEEQQNRIRETLISTLSGENAVKVEIAGREHVCAQESSQGNVRIDQKEPQDE